MGKVTNSQLDTKNESQEVSPFPTGDHKAIINRRGVQMHSKDKTEKHIRSTKVPPWNGQLNILLEGLKTVFLTVHQPHPYFRCGSRNIDIWFA